MKEMIRGFDQSLLTKAGKVDFFEMRNTLQSKVAQEDVKASEEKLLAKVETFRADVT